MYTRILIFFLYTVEPTRSQTGDTFSSLNSATLPIAINSIDHNLLFNPKSIAFFSIPKGQATVLVVGGALEAANSDKDCLKLVLNRRKGFIKLALRFGVDLVPTFSFGENSIYDQIPNPVGRCKYQFFRGPT